MAGQARHGSLRPMYAFALKGRWLVDTVMVVLIAFTF
jgi:hypothetical protein